MHIDFFMFIIFILGIYLIYISSKIDTNTIGCDSKNLKNATKTVLIIGVVFIVMTFAHLTCNLNCNCDRDRKIGEFMYLLFGIVLGVTLIVLFSIIKAESKTSNCKNIKGNGNILITGIILLILSLVRFGYSFSYKNLYEIKRKNQSLGMVKL